MWRMKRSARFSEDRKRRFELVRDWSEGEPLRLANFAMLNPSDAGEEKDDPTVRKCIGFARRWGYNGIAVTNLTACVSTDPWGLPPWSGLDPENTAALCKWIKSAEILVAAWGSQPRAIERTIALPELIHHFRELAHPATLHCIGETLKGSPCHPSRAPYTDRPLIWREM